MCTLVQNYEIEIKVIIKQGLLLICFFSLFSRALQPIEEDREGEEGEAGGSYMSMTIQDLVKKKKKEEENKDCLSTYLEKYFSSTVHIVMDSL